MLYFVFSYANTLDVLTMEIMAKEALEIFLETRVLGEYVSTDFKDEFKNPGDTVVAPYPQELDADRLPEAGTMSLTNVTASEHSIKLNQHLYVAVPFLDREKMRSTKSLIDFFAAPMARALAKKYDRTIQGQIFDSYLKTVGKLGSSIVYNDIVNANMIQTENNVPVDGRNMIIGPRIGAQVRKDSSFVDKLSLTDASLVRTGVIGQIGGYLVSETNSFASIAETTPVAGAINNSGGYAAGTLTNLVLDGFTGTYVAGVWVKINGVPYRTTAKTDNTGNLIGVVLDGGLRDAVANDDVVSVYTYPLVNLVAGYAAGYEGAIAYDGGVTPKVGQGVTFGTTGRPYSVVKVSGTEVTLNRPLDAAIINDQPIFLMPGGNYGICINRNSIQVVTRPMIAPEGGGVIAATAVGENFAISILKSYVHLERKEIISMDCIMGVANHFPEYSVLVLG